MQDSNKSKPSIKGKAVAVSVGAGLGAWGGAGIGIAGAFGAISGMLPLAALGAYLAHRAHKAIKAADVVSAPAAGFTRRSAEELVEARKAVLALRKTQPAVKVVINRRPRSPNAKL